MRYPLLATSGVHSGVLRSQSHALSCRTTPPELKCPFQGLLFGVDPNCGPTHVALPFDGTITKLPASATDAERAIARAATVIAARSR